MKKSYVEKYAKVKDHFTPFKLVDILVEVANTLAPSQSIRETRGPLLKKMVEESELENYEFDLDYLGTGNCVLHAKGVEPKILFISHLDQISYLIDKKVDATIWRLIPFCKHLSQIKVKAVALRYDLKNGQFRQSAIGEIFSIIENGELVPYFELHEGDLESGDRIVFESPLSVEGDSVKGNLDNAAGVAANFLAGLALLKVAPKSKVGFVFSDEEEGPTESLMYFARGVRRLMHKMETPEVCFIIDGHGGKGGEDIGKGTFFTEKTGGGVATITPPQLFIKVKQLAEELKIYDVQLFEDEGRVSRSDDIPCLAVTPNVLSVGFSTVRRHHDFGPAEASISDLVNLAKVIFWFGLTFDEDSSNND